MQNTQTNEFLHGTLETFILKAVESAPRQDYAIARHLEQATGAALRIEGGTLYPALHRLERRRRLEVEWGMSELEAPTRTSGRAAGDAAARMIASRELIDVRSGAAGGPRVRDSSSAECETQCCQ